MQQYLLALDQGTTSSRALLFDAAWHPVSMAQHELPPVFPAEGWVEQDPMSIWSTQIAVATEALMKIGGSWEQVAGIGITNQRETVIVWERSTGRPIYPAIVWQCRRTAAECERLKAEGTEPLIREKTGLLVDPYFSATKLRWILDRVEGAEERARKGELCFGTVDSFLLFHLTGGRVHATDYSNASRTMLFNIHTLSWDEDLLRLFRIPHQMLPEVRPSASLFGYTDPALFGARLPIGGIAGDQQAALFGQCCFDRGDLKNTYGTGAFLLMNTGDRPCQVSNGLITTVAWGLNGKVTYALEGSVFSCGAAIQWLRDGLGIIKTAADSERCAAAVPDSGGVTVVPAFQGLGAPWWDPYARGIIIGITRATTKHHIVRATLEAIAYQTADVIALMEESTGMRVRELRVDGGASRNGLLLSFQSDVLDIPLRRPACPETTALGAGYLAALSLGLCSSTDEIRAACAGDTTVSPTADDLWRASHLREWHRAVERSRLWREE